MSIRLSLIVLIFALMAGAISIFLANRLMRKYNLAFLSSYFYFLIFMLIFGAYSIIGSQMTSYLMKDHDVAAETVQSVTSIMIVLGIPFLILGLFMFLRLTRELMQRQLPRIASALYFIFSLLLFGSYIFFHVRGGSIGSVSFDPDRLELGIIFSALLLLVFGYCLIYILLKVRHVIDFHERTLLKRFSLLYAVIIFLNIVTINLVFLHEVFGLLFIAGFMGYHLIPIMILYFHHQKHYVASIETNSFEEKMLVFSDKFGISKREAEVIELICKGMTNQEISDSLFISVQTVKDHVHRIFLKTGVKNRVQLSNLLQ